MRDGNSMKQKFIRTIGFVCFAFWACALMGSIRKNQDPILETQTSGILHKDKMEEIKDGEKGAPTPSFKLFDKFGFLAEPPINEEQKNIENENGYLPDSNAVLPENPIPDEVYEAMGNTPDDEDAWWMEEEPVKKTADTAESTLAEGGSQY